MNEILEMEFWNIFFITVKPTNQYPHIGYIYNEFMTKEVCDDMKSDKKVKYLNFSVYPLY